MTSTIPVTDLTPEVPNTIAAAVWVGPHLSVTLTVDGVHSEVQGPGGWRVVRVTVTPDTDTGQVGLTRVVGDGRAYMDLLTPTVGEYDGHPFDGNTMPAGRVNHAWDGLSDESQSVAQETPVTLTLLDTTPTINGVNTYRVITTSADGATTVTQLDLETKERLWAFLSTGEGFADIERFSGNLRWSVASTRASALVEAAGRSKPIALFGDNTSSVLSGSATVTPTLGSSPRDLDEFFKRAELTCVRLPDGTRRFGVITGEVASPRSTRSEVSFTLREAS